MSERSKRYVIIVDDDYITGFDGPTSQNKISHMGWSPQAVEIGSIQLSQFRSDAKVFDGNINLKSALDKFYERIRYGDFDFDSLEVHQLISKG